MKKEKIINFLAYSCFLLPGNRKFPKTWFVSLPTVLSLIGLFFVLFSCVNEFVGFRKSRKDKENNDTILFTFKFMPIRPVAFCLKPQQVSELAAMSKPKATDIPGKSEESRPPPRKPELLEEIVNTGYQLLIFVVNISIRIFIFFNFPSIIATFTLAFPPPEELQRSLMHNMWLKAAQRWSSCEKVFLFVVLFSQMQREVDLFIQFYFSVKEVGVELVDIQCVLTQLMVEQAKVLLARELVLEIATFVLLIIIKTFVNILWTVCGGERPNPEESDVLTDNLNSGEGNIGSEKKDRIKQMNKALFVKTLHAPTSERNVFASGSMVFPYVDDPYSTSSKFNLLFQTGKGINVRRGLGTKTGPNVEAIYSKMNFIVGMYFDLMAIWERSLIITGFITLVLFCDLTTTFCLNTYTTLDNSIKFGLFSGMGSCGIIKGIIIVTKLVCVCNAAQTLRDMTQILIRRILKLKLELLSLPKEIYRSRAAVENEFLTGANQPSMCERCRGVGSFLSEVVSYIRNHPFQLSAMGYFTVSRSSLTTITGVIVTYLVVLVQFQSYSTSTT